MWEQIPVGCPKKLRARAWTNYGEDGDDARYPTAAYAWDVVGTIPGESKALYKIFINELDALTPLQINWRPYTDDREWGFELNVMCKQDQLLWWCIMPMICVYVVEYHLPQRIAAQFGKVQRTPPGGIVKDTGGYDLHLLSRRKNQSITDWGEQHAKYVTEWNQWKTRKDVERRVIDWEEYSDHLLWFDDGIKHRLRLRPQWTTAYAESLYDDDSENKAYNDSIRELQGGFREYEPITNRVSSKLNKSIFDASDALSSIPGTRASENKLRGTVKKFVKKCHKLVGLLGCATSSADVIATAAQMHSLASSSQADSSSMAVQDDEEEGEDDDDEEEDEEEGEEEGAEEEHGEEEEEHDEEEDDEEEEYDDHYGPPATQTTQHEKRNVPKKDWKSPSPFQKARPTHHKKAAEKRSKNNEDRTAKSGRRD
ncbi:hypothetical protein ACQJBY_052484 [Aegilops geniculata]